jgi:hypothetical protein
MLMHNIELQEKTLKIVTEIKDLYTIQQESSDKEKTTEKSKTIVKSNNSWFYVSNIVLIYN